MRLTNYLSAIALFGLSAAPAIAAEPIGSATLVVNKVTAELESDTRDLTIGAGVHQDELIAVDPDASSELKLNDETKMALGPGAKLRLDKFVYDPNQTEGAIAVNLVKGAFRFMTGIAAKPSYVVRVPQASITVRGTIFDVFVQENLVTWVLLHEGSLRACNDHGRCQDLDEPGKLIRILGNGDVGAPTRWTGLPQKTKSFDDAFPFVDKPPQIDPTPILTREAILIDIDIPKKVRHPDPPKDRGDRNDDGPKRKAGKAKKSDGVKKEATRRRRGGRDDDDDKAKIMDGIGIAIGIGGGFIGKHRGGGGHRGGDGPMRRHGPN